jgi:hypothetical protein
MRHRVLPAAASRLIGRWGVINPLTLLPRPTWPSSPASGSASDRRYKRIVGYMDTLNTCGHKTGKCAQRHDGAGPVKPAPSRWQIA